MSEILLKLNIAFIILSFIVYSVAKYKEYKGEFNILKFILGNAKCKGNWFIFKDILNNITYIFYYK